MENGKFTAFEGSGKLYQYCHMPFGVTTQVSTIQQIMDHLIKKYKLKKPYGYSDNVTVTEHDKDEHSQNLKLFLNATSCEGFTLYEKKHLYSVTKSDLLGY